MSSDEVVPGTVPAITSLRADGTKRNDAHTCLTRRTTGVQFDMIRDYQPFHLNARRRLTSDLGIPPANSAPGSSQEQS